MDRSFKKLSDKVWIKVAMHSVIGGGGGGYSWEFSVACIQMLTLFQTKKCHFSHLFSDLASKKLCRHYLDWNTNKKNFLIYTFLFLSYSFGIERTNTFIHSRSSHENHTRFQTKIQWAKSIPVFRPKQRKNSTFWGGTFLYGLCEGVPHPAPRVLLSLPCSEHIKSQQ